MIATFGDGIKNNLGDMSTKTENDDKLKIAKDGGYASRKLWFSIVTSVLIVVSSLVVPVTALEITVMGLVSVCGVYVAGNTVVKMKAGTIEKAKVAQEKEDSDE
jgi:hypothetical protein